MTRPTGTKAHVHRACHSPTRHALALVGLVAVLMVTMFTVGCAPSTGWRRSDRRACRADAPPIVCAAAEPDRGHELRVGGRTILPGECARAPDDARGGRLKIVVRHRDGGDRDDAIRVRPGRVTVVEIDERGRADVVERLPCDATPVI